MKQQFSKTLLTKIKKCQNPEQFFCSTVNSPVLAWRFFVQAYEHEI